MKEKKTKVDGSTILAKYVTGVTYDDLPPEVVEATKRDILDTLGVAIAGSSVAGGKEITELVREWQGKGESTLIMQGISAPAPFAALVNGTMAHALDFDDAYERAILHAGVSSVPAAFAVSERIGAVSGKALITAVTLGTDVCCRLGDASKIDPSEVGFMYTSVYGFFGAAAAASKLLNLSEEQMLNAFGIAYAQASGNFQAVVDGALTKRMQAGFASSGGLMSALMASKGLTGAKDSLEGQKGLFSTYLQGRYDPDALTVDLGRRFAVVDLSFKPYPCCRSTHPAIDATLALAKDNHITPEDVDEISVCTGEAARLVCEPLEVKQNPRVFVDAQFSIPWMVATALVKRKVSIEDVTPKAITNKKVLALASKVKPEIDNRMGSGRGTPPAEVRIKMKNTDKVYILREGFPKGHPSKPMNWGELCDKFRDCASHGAKPLSRDSIQKVIKMITGLERVKDVGEIMKLLS
jgi:2-methylcitrate dehydratase PrpD